VSSAEAVRAAPVSAKIESKAMSSLRMVPPPG
jgi:hypothetical protein